MFPFSVVRATLVCVDVSAKIRGSRLPAGPEDKAREQIDRLLEATGWVLQDKDQLNLGSWRRRRRAQLLASVWTL